MDNSCLMQSLLSDLKGLVGEDAGTLEIVVDNAKKHVGSSSFCSTVTSSSTGGSSFSSLSSQRQSFSSSTPCSPMKSRRRNARLPRKSRVPTNPDDRWKDSCYSGSCSTPMSANRPARKASGLLPRSSSLKNVTIPKGKGKSHNVISYKSAEDRWLSSEIRSPRGDFHDCTRLSTSMPRRPVRSWSPSIPMIKLDITTTQDKYGGATNTLDIIANVFEEIDTDDSDDSDIDLDNYYYCESSSDEENEDGGSDDDEIYYGQGGVQTSITTAIR